MDSAVIAPIFNFALVVVVLYFAARKPFAAFLAQRSANVASQIAEGEQLSSEAEKSLALWESNWRSLEAHAKQLAEDARAAMTKVRETTLANARREAERIRHDGQLVGQSEALRARDGLGRELAERSVLAAGQYLKGHLADDDQRKLVYEYVEKLTNGKA